MTHPNSPPFPPASAAIGFGPWPSDLYGTPQVADVDTPGYVTILIGRLHSGLPVIITASSLEWLEDLESAIQVARARGLVQAGMVPS